MDKTHLPDQDNQDYIADHPYKGVEYIPHMPTRSVEYILAHAETLIGLPVDQVRNYPDIEGMFYDFLRHCEIGNMHAISFTEDGQVLLDSRIKMMILVGFRIGEIVPVYDNGLPSYDKCTYLPQEFKDFAERGIRINPMGAGVRRGAHLGDKSSLMNGAYVNVGGYVGERTMIDTNALVGSCAYVGNDCHISAGVVIGGVLEPVNARPCIVENNVMIGANSLITEGVHLKENVVVAPLVGLTASTAVYDFVTGDIYRSTPENPLVIPTGAVIVPGAIPYIYGSERSTVMDSILLRIVNGTFDPEMEQWPKMLLWRTGAVIKKYRDSSTNAHTALEESLR